MTKVLISACLLGQKVRYDGHGLPQETDAFHRLAEHVEWVPLCPEVAGGLPTPRTPAEIIAAEGNTKRVMTAHGDDVTEAFVQGAERALSLCQQQRIRFALLTESSPSCGSSLVYNGKFEGEKIAGQGITAALLRQHGIRVFSQFDCDALLALLQEE